MRDIDAAAAEASRPLRGTKTATVLGALATLGDQPQLRMLSGATIVAGLLRRDGRLTRAGVRMLLAHELATAMKTVVKHGVDRRRPRSLDGDPGAQRLRFGSNPAKEESSFPSGHSAGSAAVARAFARSYPERKTGAYAAAGVAAFIQIPRCAHYPSDVGAGLGIGVVAEAIVAAIMERYAKRDKQPATPDAEVGAPDTRASAPILSKGLATRRAVDAAGFPAVATVGRGGPTSE